MGGSNGAFFFFFIPGLIHQKKRAKHANQLEVKLLSHQSVNHI